MCGEQQLPTAAQEPCQGFRGLLVQGISAEEESPSMTCFATSLRPTSYR